ncbi:MAG: hypothetical protein ABI565_04080, partial [Vicinamibacteria bacterium]
MLLFQDSLQAEDPVLASLRSLIARGRHAEADLLASAHTRRLSCGQSKVFLALRVEIALGLGRFAAALDRVGEALKGMGPGAGLIRVLETARIRALLGLGRFREVAARVEAG